MITLLRDTAADFPDDYLAARLRGRRAQRGQRERSALSAMPFVDEEGIELEQEAEVRWLYGQMRRQTRTQLAPLFVLFELRRLVNCLRLADGNDEWQRQRDRLLSPSLWHQGLVRQGSRCRSARELVQVLERWFAARLPGCKGLTRNYDRHDQQAMERQLLGAVLQQGATMPGSARCRDLCRALIDQVNLSGLVKSWLWRLPASPPAIPEGHLSPARLGRIWRQGDPGRAGLPAGVSHTNLTPEQVADLEEERKNDLLQAIRQQGKQLDPVAAIIEYLAFLEAETVYRRSQLAAEAGVSRDTSIAASA